MAAYRIYRMKEQASQQFRWAPHVSGATQIKRKDYAAAANLCHYLMDHNLHSPEAKEMQTRRRRIERLFSLTKHRYGLPRFTLRGLSGTRIQWLLTLLMVNMRYLEDQTRIFRRFRAYLFEISVQTKRSCQLKVAT